MRRTPSRFVPSLALILLMVASTHGTAVAATTLGTLGQKITWPEFHGTGDSRGYNKQEATVGPDNVFSLGLSWIGNGASQQEDLVFNSSPVLAKGLVFFGTSAGQVLAFRANGCGDSECFPVWRSQLSQGIFSTPAYFNGMLYVGTTSPEGALYAFTAAGCGHPTCSPI